MKATLVAIAGTIFLTLSVALFILLLAFQNAKPSSPCAGQFGPITYLHRGNLTYAQENTLDAIINGTSNNMKNPEMDVTAVNSGEAVLFHDTSMYRMTGIEKDIKDVDLQEAINTTILSEIDGHRYGSTNQIPLMKTAVDAICDEDSTGIGINFDTDTADAIQSTVQALKNSNCKNTSNRTIWSAGYPEVVNAAHKYLKEERMDNRISIYMPPGEYFFLGLKFFLKTRLLQSVLTSGSSMLSLHRTVHDVEQDLIQSWRDDGWCLGIWGIRPEDISNYNVVSFCSFLVHFSLLFFYSYSHLHVLYDLHERT